MVLEVGSGYVDPQRPGRLSELGGRFAAGILRHAGALAAIERRDGPLVNAEEAAEEDAAPTGEPNAGSVDSTVSAPN